MRGRSVTYAYVTVTYGSVGRHGSEPENPLAVPSTCRTRVLICWSCSIRIAPVRGRRTVSTHRPARTASSAPRSARRIRPRRSRTYPELSGPNSAPPRASDEPGPSSYGTRAGRSRTSPRSSAWPSRRRTGGLGTCRSTGTRHGRWSGDGGPERGVSPAAHAQTAQRRHQPPQRRRWLPRLSRGTGARDTCVVPLDRGDHRRARRRHASGVISTPPAPGVRVSRTFGRGVIGNTQDFGSCVPGSSPGGRAVPAA